MQPKPHRSRKIQYTLLRCEEVGYCVTVACPLFAGGLFVFIKFKNNKKTKKAMRTTKQNISNHVNGKIICFDDYNFDFGYLYVFFDPSTDELCAGGCFNTGISRDYSINYDFDFSIDENLQALYEHIIEENMQ